MAGFILEIDIRKLLAVVVAHDKAGGQFLDGPGRREAARRQSRHRVDQPSQRHAYRLFEIGSSEATATPLQLCGDAVEKHAALLHRQIGGGGHHRFHLCIGDRANIVCCLRPGSTTPPAGNVALAAGPGRAGASFRTGEQRPAAGRIGGRAGRPSKTPSWS